MPHRTSGRYRVGDGSVRAAVWEGKKAKTSGGLTKADLKLNAQGYIVSVKKSAIAKKNFKGFPKKMTVDVK
jgi:hypothetical protein